MENFHAKDAWCAQATLEAKQAPHHSDRVSLSMDTVCVHFCMNLTERDVKRLHVWLGEWLQARAVELDQ
jgi:hypothetical protein